MHESKVLYDIYDFDYQPIWETGIFKIFLILFFVFIAAILLWYRYRHKKNVSKKAWEKAFDDLRLLNPALCESRDDFKRFYFDLTRVVKWYLQDRYGWHTVDKTDEELISCLEKMNFDTQLLDEIKNLLHSSVGVRFAQAGILKVQADRDLKAVFAIVEKTIVHEDKVQ